MGSPEFCAHEACQTLHVTGVAMNNGFGIVPMSSDRLRVLLLHRTSLTKLKFKDKLIENSKMLTSEYYTKHGALLSTRPKKTFLAAHTWSQPFGMMFWVVILTISTYVANGFDCHKRFNLYGCNFSFLDAFTLGFADQVGVMGVDMKTSEKF